MFRSGTSFLRRQMNLSHRAFGCGMRSFRAASASWSRRRSDHPRLWKAAVGGSLALAGITAVGYDYISCIEVACQPPGKGKVFLVGAGPGAADLLTLRAARLLSEADVVVADELLGEEVLQHCKPSCEIIRMGKRGGRAKSAKQADINDALVSHCKEGKLVVRLKGGDPLLFGRAADEIRACIAHGCEWEIVPGITSVFAAAAEEGVLLTHKELSSTITIATGHDPSLLDFKALGRLETVAFIMATRTLDIIAQELIQAGKSRDTPVCIIKRATFEDKQTFCSTLGALATDMEEASLSPAVIIVGNVAKFAEEGPHPDL